jgi:hypothetical protein
MRFANFAPSKMLLIAMEEKISILTSLATAPVSYAEVVH